MSDLYRLAVALQDAPEQSIARAINERSMSIAEFKDIFDLSQALLSPKSQLLLLSGITASQLKALRQMTSEGKLSREQISLLVADFLIFKEDSGSPLIADWLLDRLRELPVTGAISVVQDIEGAADQADVDRDCGIHAFEAIQAITEIIFDLEQNLVREVAKGSIGLPDVKRLASHLGKDKDYVRAIFELGKSMGLFVASDSKLQPSKLAKDWLVSPQVNRWIELSKGWLNLASPSGVKELQNQRKHLSDLKSLISSVFPFMNLSPGSRVNRLFEVAEIIGLSTAGHLSSWFDETLSESWPKLGKSLSLRLPREQERIIIQGDLSIIAPGPLPAAVELRLRKFAITESIGLAPSYRLTASSLSTGLEEGLSELEIRELLEKLSGQALPQPVDYLIKEVAERFGRIKISQTEIGSKLFISDDLLKKQLIMDSKLKQFSIRSELDFLYSRTDAESLYFGLRENGYLAVRVLESGEVVSPSSIQRNTETPTDLLSQIKWLRDQEINTESEPVASETERKIILAIKSKSTIEVEVSANGKTMFFTLEPIGMANGRLRAKDRKADIERTLPVLAITSIKIG